MCIETWEIGNECSIAAYPSPPFSLYLVRQAVRTKTRLSSLSTPSPPLAFCLRINPRLLAGGGLAVCSRCARVYSSLQCVKFYVKSHTFVLCNPEAICSVAASPVKGASSLPKRSSPALVEPPQPSALDARLLCRRTTSPASYKITNTLLL
jgi:hypothetical protein